MIFYGFRDALLQRMNQGKKVRKDIPHVFISYNWGHQSTIVQLANQLKVLSIDELDAFVSEVSSSSSEYPVRCTNHVLSRFSGGRI